MSTEVENIETAHQPTPYKETIKERPERNPPIVYNPTKPRELFDKYRDQIMKGIHKVWPKVADNYVAEPFQARFNYYDYGGQYNFICELPGGQPTYITVTESFEEEDGDLANDDAERRRRVIVSVS